MNKLNSINKGTALVKEKQKTVLKRYLMIAITVAIVCVVMVSKNGLVIVTSPLQPMCIAILTIPQRSHHRLRLRMVSRCLTETSAQTGWVRTCPILRVNVPPKTRNVPPRLRNLQDELQESRKFGKNESPQTQCLRAFLAEPVGFEPTCPCGQTVFKTASL